jgi:hypothetical protein
MSSSDYFHRSTCRMCDSTSIAQVMKLTPTPPGNNLLKEDELSNPEPTYPLELYFCEQCHHLQLGHVVDPRVLFQNHYTYVSATSAQFVKHLEVYAADMIERFNLKPGVLVTDIGSNDGTCLSFFKTAGMKVLGVDPAKEIASRATESGIETVADFFSYELAKDLREKFGPVRFATSHNACAHIDDLFDVVQGVEHWLSDDGVFVLEVGYFVDVYTNTWFDTIYHEHLDFHTVSPFEELFARVNMEVISVQRVSPQGGSIRVMAQKRGGKFKRDSSVDELIKLEHDIGLDKEDTFRAFDEKICNVRDQLQALVHSLKSEGKTIAGFGAPTKATTLMTHFHLGADILDFVVDDNPLKQGSFTPVSHIPIYSAEALYDKRPDYVLILAWNFSEPIMNMHKKYQEDGGKFIIPMPVPLIVE